jgi:hypothetical protein
VSFVREAEAAEAADPRWTISSSGISRFSFGIFPKDRVDL